MTSDRPDPASFWHGITRGGSGDGQEVSWRFVDPRRADPRAGGRRLLRGRSWRDRLHRVVGDLSSDVTGVIKSGDDQFHNPWHVLIANAFEAMTIEASKMRSTGSSCRTRRDGRAQGRS